jgi:DNA-binding transcriptional MerR regulator
VKRFFGISAAAAAVPCAEGTLRAVERRGLIKPMRDTGNRRQLTEAEIRTVRRYLKKLRQRPI